MQKLKFSVIRQYILFSSNLILSISKLIEFDDFFQVKVYQTATATQVRLNIMFDSFQLSYTYIYSILHQCTVTYFSAPEIGEPLFASYDISLLDIH